MPMTTRSNTEKDDVFFSPENKQENLVPASVDELLTSQHSASSASTSHTGIRETKGLSPLYQAASVQIELLGQLTDKINSFKLRSPEESTDQRYTTSMLSNIPIADGQDPLKLIEFVVHIQQIVDLQIASEKILINEILLRTTGQLQIWWAKASKENKFLWTELKQHLVEEFIPPMVRNRLTNTQVRRLQKPGERLLDFAEDIHSKSKALLCNISEEELLVHIWDSANYSTLLQISTLPIPKSFRELRILSRNLDETTRRIEEAKMRECQAAPQKTNSATSFKNTKN